MPLRGNFDIDSGSRGAETGALTTPDRGDARTMNSIAPDLPAQPDTALSEQHNERMLPPPGLPRRKALAAMLFAALPLAAAANAWATDASRESMVPTDGLAAEDAEQAADD